MGSKIELAVGDACDLDTIADRQEYDVVMCCGVLVHLDQDAATAAVRAMLAHTKGLLGIITWAHPRFDNAQLQHSYVRPDDLGFVHNPDQMVSAGGGRVVFRAWTRPSEIARYPRNPPSFTIARPGNTISPRVDEAGVSSRATAL